ncbi:potassium channel family protein [Pontibacter sp. HSC-14F20]|uniref:potassium channel family protein n=1 Tax=Pontibacter sp. HSC-14F20 TaxID=2864136 RepID=UPI001C73B310|nr:potassium channel family protein [Pontibacter sp. HSC-14F20]MBX0331846.1 potassium channel family protein [Pontibacter sp. HSC-14F20]
MQILYALAGIAIILFVMRDLITTTLSFEGGGRLTNFVSETIWHLCLKLAGYDGKKKMLERVGHMLLVLIILSWVAGMWLGSFLLLLSDPASILNSNTDQIATAWEKLYFAGYTLSTMGNGDYKPGSYVWDIVANLLAFSGLAFITISITYIMPVLSAVILQVKLSVFLNSLGNSPQQVLLNSWNGENFDRLLKHDADLADMITQHSQNHKAYPIIHYFHSVEQRQSVILNLTIFDEAINFLKFGVQDEARPSDADLLTIRGAQDYYLYVLERHHKNEEQEPYSFPEINWDALIEAGIPLKTDRLNEFNSTETYKKRRETLTYLLYQDGWQWKAIYRPNPV